MTDTIIASEDGGRCAPDVCFAAFDFDSDGDVHVQDYAVLATVFNP